MAKKNKYHAIPTGGYDSRKESCRAAHLRLMLRQGLISELREQVSFELIPAQYEFRCLVSSSCPDGLFGDCRRADSCPHFKRNGKRILLERSVRYIADFVYVDNATGQTIVEDTKGVRTKEYIIKRKLMLAVHGIRIREI